MKIFLDTANVTELREGVAMGLVDGCTTNPSLIAKEKRSVRPLLEEICSIVPGDVSLEVVAADFEGMMKEGKELAQVAPNVVVKCPLTRDGLKAVKHLTGEGIRVNQTLCFSAPQALLSAKGGGRLHQPVSRAPGRYRRGGDGPGPRHLPDLSELRVQDAGVGGLDPEPAPCAGRCEGRGACGDDAVPGSGDAD